jgi:hypothetical protein
MLPLCVTNKLPAPIPSIEKGNDLMGIEMVGEIQEADGATKGLCKIGAATTNQMFREWAVSNCADTYRPPAACTYRRRRAAQVPQGPPSTVRAA